MRTVLLSLILYFSCLDARENPFFPASAQEVMPITSNYKEDLTPLEKVSMMLPDTARVVQKVTIEYKNLDGSISSKSIDLYRKVDWHLPVFISQSYTQSGIKTTQPTVATSSKSEHANFGFINFSFEDYQITIKTADKLLRKFVMTNPHRIVLDFKRDASFRSKSKALTVPPFKSIKIGNHRGYYRAVIALDGKYRISTKTRDGFLTIKVY